MNLVLALKVGATGFTGEFDLTKATQSINQVPINPTNLAYQSINSIRRLQKIQSIKYWVLGLID